MQPTSMLPTNGFLGRLANPNNPNADSDTKNLQAAAHKIDNFILGRRGFIQP